MCGITGFISTKKIDYEDTINTMISKLIHRGPDSNGFWIDPENKVGFGHTRLSILDLSEAGHQPMHSITNRYVISFNGEIYNHLSIRLEIEKDEKVNWIGHSDTETLLKAIEKWGVEQTIKKCIGMFAFALWDKKEKTITLARDRMGEKPLYYGWVNKSFVFGSELKAIKQFPEFNNEIDRNSLALFLKYSSVPEPYSIYENIYKLEAGSYLIYNLVEKNLNKNNYFSIDKFSSESNPDQLTDKESISKLETILTTAVGSQMLSDVPIGAFLSGGVDSTTVAVLMQKQSTTKINTFSIGFNQEKYNEAEHARIVAKHLGTNHHDMYVSDKDVLDVIPLLPKMYSEPFSDSSQIPTYLVSKIAKNKVTVCLTGDAGDELFCGYNRYHLANNTWNKISKIPRPLRNAIGLGINAFPYQFWNLLLPPYSNDNSQEGTNKADKFLKASLLLDSKSRKDFYHKGFMSHNNDVESWVLKSKTPKTIFDSNVKESNEFYSEMMRLDLKTYLPNDNLVKVDRAAMAVSLETRVPFLDYRVVQHALNLPLNLKLRNGIDKWILREVLYKYVPKKLIDRPKMGFAVPLAEWLRGPLKDWAEELINEKRLLDEGYFNVKIVRKKWMEHILGKRNWQYQLWDVLMFQSWLDEQ